MYPAVQWIGSIHKTKGRKGYRPEAVVIHIMEGSLRSCDSWFNSPESNVSAHYGIGRDGTVHQYVGESDTAFHAGRRSTPTWTELKADVNPNLYTIGIEHEGQGDDPWTEAMYEASSSLVRDICARWSIPIDRAHIVGHREIYGRKTCPGSRVDLNRLVAMTRGKALSMDAYNFVPHPGTVRARTRLNLRRGAPTTAADAARTVDAGTPLDFTGWTSSGMSVNGNQHWYRDADGNFFWAGGTEEPVPGV
jgi:N-acetyl-anhydromuramyl-L-alanine amidase AmpD